MSWSISIIGIVNVSQIHDWPVTTADARSLQAQLAGRVLKEGGSEPPALVAGVDISVNRSGMARAAVVVLDFPAMSLVEAKVEEGRPGFPYIPGLLTFREAPLILAACRQLESDPDLFMVDGQGIAHPRRFGIAAHLGLILDRPTIGCAKSRLCGEHDNPDQGAGSHCELTDHGEVIGAVVRTRTGVKPLYISIGHKVDLSTAVTRVLECCRGYRLPQPTRMAHLVAGGGFFHSYN